MFTQARAFLATAAATALLAGTATIAIAADKLIISTATPPQHMQTTTMETVSFVGVRPPAAGLSAAD